MARQCRTTKIVAVRFLDQYIFIQDSDPSWKFSFPNLLRLPGFYTFLEKKNLRWETDCLAKNEQLFEYFCLLWEQKGLSCVDDKLSRARNFLNTPATNITEASLYWFKVFIDNYYSHWFFETIHVAVKENLSDGTFTIEKFKIWYTVSKKC